MDMDMEKENKSAYGFRFISFIPMISIYSVAHFLVDFACAFLMFRSIAGTQDWRLYILLYNFCAFAMQMPLGIIADKLNRNFLFAAAGCVLAGAAYGFTPIPAVTVVTLGLGNGMFHIGGGIDVLNISKEKSGALGVFVSPGAFGIYFGTILGKGNTLTAFPVILSLFSAAILIVGVHMLLIRRGTYSGNAEFSLESVSSPQIFSAIACLFLIVCLRSYVGLALNLPWKSSGYWGVILVCAVVLGKTAGGFAADRFGITRTVVLSLSIAAILYIFPHIPLAGITAVLLFNMTMPVTLWIMAKIFPGAKGFSFGLLTFALFLGFLPVHFGADMPPFLPSVFAVASMVLLLVSLRKANI